MFLDVFGIGLKAKRLWLVYFPDCLMRHERSSASPYLSHFHSKDTNGPHTPRPRTTFSDNSRYFCAFQRPVLRPTSSDDSGDVPDLVSTDQSMPPTSGTEAQIVHREGKDPSLGQLVSDTDDKEIQVDPSLGVARSPEVLPGEVGAARDEVDESMRSARHAASLCLSLFLWASLPVLADPCVPYVSWCRCVLELNHQCHLLGVVERRARWQVRFGISASLVLTCLLFIFLSSLPFSV